MLKVPVYLLKKYLFTYVRHRNSHRNKEVLYVPNMHAHVPSEV